MPWFYSFRSGSNFSNFIIFFLCLPFFLRYYMFTFYSCIKDVFILFFLSECTSVVFIKPAFSSLSNSMLGPFLKFKREVWLFCFTCGTRIIFWFTEVFSFMLSCVWWNTWIKIFISLNISRNMYQAAERKLFFRRAPFEHSIINFWLWSDNLVLSTGWYLLNVSQASSFFERFG